MLSLSARSVAAVPMPVRIRAPTLIADICVEPGPGNGGEEQNQRCTERPGIKGGGMMRNYGPR